MSGTPNPSTEARKALAAIKAGMSVPTVLLNVGIKNIATLAQFLGKKLAALYSARANMGFQAHKQEESKTTHTMKR